MEPCTHIVAPWKAKIYNYGGGYGEMGFCYQSPEKEIERKKKGQGCDPRASKERAQRRAKSMVRRYVMAAGFDHMVTLTYRENVTSFGQAQRDFARFVRLVHKRRPDWKYVAVPEQQDRGAFHWHVAVKGFQDILLLRAAWHKVVGKGQGAVNVVYHKAENSRGSTWRRERLARYLVKYITKTFEFIGLDFGSQRYRVSKGIEICYESVACTSKNDLLGLFMDSFGGWSYCHFDDKMAVGWLCSW